MPQFDPEKIAQVQDLMARINAGSYQPQTAQQVEKHNANQAAQLRVSIARELFVVLLKLQQTNRFTGHEVADLAVEYTDCLLNRLRIPCYDLGMDGDPKLSK